MESSIVTAKGGTTIPNRVLRVLNVSAGDKIQFLIDPNGNITFRAATGSIKDLRRSVHPARKALTDEEMQARMEKDVTDHVLGRGRRQD